MSDQFCLTPDIKNEKAFNRKPQVASRHRFSLNSVDASENDFVHGNYEPSIDEDDAFTLRQEPEMAQPKQGGEGGIKILYIQMQYCDGETLEHFLKKNPNKVNKKLKWKIYRQILEAVNYLHQRDIIHRDIKPENIFLDQNKDARLGDFGLAKRITPLQKQ